MDNNKNLLEVHDTFSKLSKNGIDAVLTATGALLLDHAHSSLTQSEARYRHLVNRMEALVLELTPAGNITYINGAITLITGFPADEWVNDNWFDLLLPMQKSTSYDLLRQQFLFNGELDGFKTSIKTLNGRPKIISWNSAHVHRADGQVERLFFFGTDITERESIEEKLRIAAIAFESQSGMLVTDANGLILQVNKAFTKITGYSSDDVFGKKSSLLKSDRQDQQFYETMWEAIRRNGFWEGEIWNRRKSGEVYPEWLSINAVKADDGNITHYIGTFSDITLNKAAEAEIKHLAYYDPLTALPNRRLLQDRLSQALSSTSRTKLYGAIFFIDLDNFKTLNDTRGHDVGDLLLIHVAKCLRESVREGDTVARQGGDEFVVLLKDLCREKDAAVALAKTLADKLRAAIDHPCILNGIEYHCKFSIGISLFNEEDTVEELLKHADLALYQAKNAGRNTLRFFNPFMQETLEKRIVLESDLRQALACRQLQLHYQPQVDLERRIIGVEALLRWQHPTRGFVQPDDFIGLAEETGLILPLGLWVLETACAQIKAWQNDLQFGNLQVAVNVSARQFRHPDFVNQVLHILKSSGALPTRLKLELTESVVLTDIDNTIEKMLAIKRVGVSLSMDDFGTGFSSLSYLARLPIDQLKIDRSFVHNIPGGKNDETITRAIITLGQGLSIDVVAEGVETEVQRGFLESHGCKTFQGFLFGKAMPNDGIEQLVKVHGR